MKTGIIAAIALMTLAFGTSAWAANFTSGNLMVYRVGDGSSPLTNIGNAVFLDEYTTNGTLVQSVMMPTNYFGASSPLIAEGRALAEGEITRSTDGRFIVLTGYGATLGQVTDFSLSSEFAQPVPRVVGLVDQFGHIDTTTTQTNALSNIESIRSAASTDGTNLWFGGDVSGIRYTTRGSALATQLSSFITNIRQLNIFSSQLYFSTGSGTRGIYAVTNGLPTTSGSFYQILSNLQSSVNSPYGFVLLSVSGGPGGLNTLYIADDNNGAIYKWSMLAGGAWVSNGVVLATNARFLTGDVNPSGKASLYIAGSPAGGGGNLYGYTDTNGWNTAPLGDGGSIGSVASWTVIVPTNKSFHGVAFAPVGGESFPAGAGRISVGPVTDFFTTGLTGGPFPLTKTYSVANPGTSAVNWSATTDVNWVTLSSTSGALSSGGSVTVTASFNVNANALAAGTYTGTITFTNTTSALGTTTRPVKLVISDQIVTPTTAFISSGPSNGPFTPLTKLYALTNGNSSFNWTANKSATWLDLSATSGFLAGGAGTNITVSINTNNANALSLGSYSDSVLFSNVSAGTLIATRIASLNIGNIYFFEDFNAYNAGNLVGQRGWTRVPSEFTFPLKVSGGQVTIPAGQTRDNEDAYKNFPVTSNKVIYAGMTLSVTSAPPVFSSYFAALYTSNNAGGFANYRLSASNTSASTFAFTARVTGQSGSPAVSGPGGLSYGATYRVIVATDVAGSNMTIYVNPTSGNLAGQTPYLTRNIAAGTPPLSAGSFVISQFASPTIPNAGVSFDKVAVSTNYTDVYNFLTSTPSGSVNSWINSAGETWTNGANWLLGVPSTSNSLVQITNGVSKTVTFVANAVQTISNLLVSAPAGLTNTLSASTFAPGTRGLTILNSLTISSGGALVWNGSFLAFRELTISGVSGGGFTVDGSVNIPLGKIVASNVVTTIGKALFGSAQMTVSNGNFFCASILVPDPDTIDNTSTFSFLGGTLRATSFTVGGGGNNTGIVTIANATLDCSTGVIAVGNNGSLTSGSGFGSMTVSNASLLASTILLGSSAGGQGEITLADGGLVQSAGTNSVLICNNFGQIGGDLSWTNIGSAMYCGYAHPGAYALSNGTSSCQDMYVGYDNAGTMTIAGGAMSILSRLTVGHLGSPMSTGAVWMTGGQLTMLGLPAIIGNSGFGQMTLSNGTVTAATMIVGNGSNPGSLTVAGGTITVLSSLTVGDCNGGHAGVVAITGGNLFVTNTAHNAVLDVRSSTSTLNGGQLKVDTLVMTNACASFTRTGGTLIYGTAVLDPARDDDGDGILNGYEQSHGLDPLNSADAGNDNDGDGQSNLAEFLAGTDATNSASAFRITATARQATTNILVTWTMGSGKTNALQRTAGDAGGNYITNNFADIFTVTNTVGTTTNYLDIGAATNVPSLYYRVRLVP